MFLCSSAILKVFVEIRKFFIKKISSALKTKTIYLPHWSLRRKINDYKNYIARPLQYSFFTKILLLR